MRQHQSSSWPFIQGHSFLTATDISQKSLGCLNLNFICSIILFSREKTINMLFILGHLTKMATMSIKYNKIKYNDKIRYDVLGQVWYLIVLISDLCLLSYFCFAPFLNIIVGSTVAQW